MKKVFLLYSALLLAKKRDEFFGIKFGESADEVERVMMERSPFGRYMTSARNWGAL